MKRVKTLSSQPPSSFEGNGIVMAAGGSFVASAWVTLAILRRVHRCRLPIEIWYLGEDDLPADVRRLFERFDVTFVDAAEHGAHAGWRPTTGWELKPYAVAHCRFAEVLLLDADNVPLVEPAGLFDDPRYRARGAAFWLDVRAINPFNPIWSMAGITVPRGHEWESGQLLIDKRRHWPGLQLTLHLNQQSHFYYRYLLGDKETFHLAWRMLNAPFACSGRVPERAMGNFPGEPGHTDVAVGLWQHDHHGRRIFLHHTDAPLVAWGRNLVCDQFDLQDAVMNAIHELQHEWNGYVRPRPTPIAVTATAVELANHRAYVYTRLGLDQRFIELRPGERIGEGAADQECFWRLDEDAAGPVLILSSRTEDTCRLRMQQDGSWAGNWLRFEQVPVELIPVADTRPSAGSPPMETPSRVLFVTPVAPNDTGNGLAMRAGNVLRQLSERNRVSLLIVPLYASGAAKRLPGWVEKRCERVCWARPPDRTTLNATSDGEARQADRAWIDEAGRAFTGEKFDTIHVFRLAAMRFAQPYLERSQHASARWHLDLDDVESRSGGRLAELFGRLGSVEDERSAQRSAALAADAEDQVLMTWDRVYVCSPEDRRYLERRVANRRAEVVVLPNRVMLPVDPPAARRSTPFTFLYVGTLSYVPNIDGLIWFCREVVPVMRELSSSRFRILVVGTGATPEIRNLAHIPEVEFIGQVESVDDWYRRSDAVVVPLRTGGGTRIKLLEALAHRRPVVATSIAAEGLDLVDGEHVLIANRPLPFANQCLRLVEDDRLAERLAAQGRTLVEQQYGIPTSTASNIIKS